MEKTKRFLNIAIGISMIICSLSLLIISTRQNEAKAQTGTTLPSGVVVAGLALLGDSYYILGYDPKDGQVVSLGRSAIGI